MPFSIRVFILASLITVSIELLHYRRQQELQLIAVLIDTFVCKAWRYAEPLLEVGTLV